MPSAIADLEQGEGNGIIKFTNCLLVKDNDLVKEDLWVSSITGKILDGQEVLFGQRAAPHQIVDLGGRILSPGLVEVQINGAYNFDFSIIPEEGPAAYGKGIRHVNKNIITTGVTSYTPTLPSQSAEVYHQALPYLAPTGHERNPYAGAEVLGAHCEGPFISPTKNGIHSATVLQTPVDGLASLKRIYGAANLTDPSPIKYVTIAPELPGALEAIHALTDMGITVAIGHSDATYEEASAGINAGATMVTHLFNAMRPLHHRNPGIFGLLGTSSTDRLSRKPFFGVISDGIHLHPTSIKIAWNAHPDGLILVTDAHRLVGMPDGVYDWTNGARFVKQGARLTLEENGKLAGSCTTLIECVTNFLNWTDATVVQGLNAASRTPAKMLGLEGVKGCLDRGADADLVVLDLEHREGGERKLEINQVWKFGKKVFEKGKEA